MTRCILTLQMAALVLVSAGAMPAFSSPAPLPAGGGSTGSQDKGAELRVAAILPVGGQPLAVCVAAQLASRARPASSGASRSASSVSR